MLVLSRKTSEELCFPNIGVTIKVVRVKGSVVQLGIEAPQFVRVLRREVLAGGLLEPIVSLAEPSRDHEFRNRLNELVLQIQLAIHANPSQLSETGLALRRLANELEGRSPVQPLAAGFAGADLAPSPEATVLVVDDVANERQLFASVLQMRGFGVLEAVDGAHALELLGATTRLPHAVLLDLEMPRVAGEMVLRSIRADMRLSRLKVLAISARSPENCVIPGSLQGFDAWFSKPLDFERLSNLLSNLDVPQPTLV
ncbi:MAG: response regulator [Planctomycetales bacterium]|nr:response regulator [Planctomycetales bacterium]